MAKVCSNKNTKPVRQTLWGSPTLWDRPTDRLVSIIDKAKIATLGHDKFEEIRFHPISSKHIVPGNPTPIDSGLTSHPGYTVLRYSFDVGGVAVASDAQIAWHDAPSLQHFDYVRSRMKAREYVRLLPVGRGNLWALQACGVGEQRSKSQAMATNGGSGCWLGQRRIMFSLRCIK